MKNSKNYSVINSQEDEDGYTPHHGDAIMYESRKQEQLISSFSNAADLKFNNKDSRTEQKNNASGNIENLKPRSL